MSINTTSVIDGISENVGPFQQHSHLVRWVANNNTFSLDMPKYKPENVEGFFLVRFVTGITTAVSKVEAAYVERAPFIRA